MSDLQTDFLTLHEFISAARAKMSDNGWDYVRGGTETETTVARNRRALDAIALRPRVLRDVSRITAQSRFLDRDIRLPVLLAPVGGLETCDEDGALAAAMGAGNFGAPIMVSSVSKRTREEIVAAGTAGAHFQLYVRGGEGFIEDQAAQAAEAGMDSFCLTVDTAVYSRRERDIVRRFQKPWRAGVDEAARDHQASLSWADVARVRKTCELPLALKGIATAEDARMAVDHGVDIVYVSNHGGRQLDHGLGSMDVLPEIAQAVSGKALIVVDGGFCRGSDIVKAMALGADLVGLGRLYCYALAAAGADGVTRMLEILEEEVREVLGLIGVNSFKELDESFVARGAPTVVHPDVFSAYPLLDRQGL